MTGSLECRETTAKIMRLIREYPHARLSVGTRASMAFYEILQALLVLNARQPILRAAMIALAHRIRNESVISNELIIREIVGSLEPGHERNEAGTGGGESLPASKTVRILRELDNLKDVIYAMPYDIDILDPHWFKVTEKTLFKAEAPTLFEQTLNEDRRADFKLYMSLLDDMQKRGLLRVGPESVAHTKLGSIVNFSGVFNYVERAYPGYFRKNEDNTSHTSDNRRFRRGDSYKHLHLRRTLRRLVKQNKDAKQVAKGDLRVRKAVPDRRCLVVLAIDHSWSMGRSRKLQYAKDSAAGLIFAVKKNRDRIALVAFSDEAVVLQLPTTRFDRPVEKLTGLRPERETNIVDALKKSRAIFSASGSGQAKHSIIITDGIPTSLRPDATCSELEHEVIREVRAMAKSDITTSVICIRDELEEGDDSLARRIASVGKGNYNLVNARDLLDQVLRDYANVKSEENIHWH